MGACPSRPSYDPETGIKANCQCTTPLLFFSISFLWLCIVPFFFALTSYDVAVDFRKFGEVFGGISWSSDAAGGIWDHSSGNPPRGEYDTITQVWTFTVSFWERMFFLVVDEHNENHIVFDEAWEWRWGLFLIALGNFIQFAIIFSSEACCSTNCNWTNHNCCDCCSNGHSTTKIRASLHGDPNIPAEAKIEMEDRALCKHWPMVYSFFFGWCGCCGAMWPCCMSQSITAYIQYDMLGGGICMTLCLAAPCVHALAAHYLAVESEERWQTVKKHRIAVVGQAQRGIQMTQMMGNPMMQNMMVATHDQNGQPLSQEQMMQQQVMMSQQMMMQQQMMQQHMLQQQQMMSGQQLGDVAANSGDVSSRPPLAIAGGTPTTGVPLIASGSPVSSPQAMPMIANGAPVPNK